MGGRVPGHRTLGPVAMGVPARAPPRPRYSFAYIEKGEVVCQSCGKTVRARAGDILFVPYGVTYASHWMGDPETVFCSCFFMVRPFSPPYGDSTFELQSIGRCEALYPDFLFLLQQKCWIECLLTAI